MKYRENRGITLMMLSITIIVLLILSGVTIKVSNSIILKAELQNMYTNMLLIQVKEKTIAEKTNFSEDTTLKGTKLSTVEGDEKIKNLKNEGIISTLDENYDSYYIWNNAELEQEGLEDIKLKEGEFFIVNYATDEIIFSEGIKYEDGTIYYELSELMNIINK